MPSPTDAQCDVAIRGAGIAGSTLFTILARHKLGPEPGHRSGPRTPLPDLR